MIGVSRETRVRILRTEIAVLIALSGLTAASAETTSPGAPTPSQAQFQKALSALAESPNDKVLREKVIKLGARVKPPPKLPEGARKRAVRGSAFLTPDASEDEIRKAAGEFQAAIDAAPWWADAYFNLAVAEERLEEPDSAIEHVKFYLAAFPDSEEGQDKLTTLEVLSEKLKAVRNLEGVWRSNTGRLQIKAKGKNVRAVWLGSDPDLVGKTAYEWVVSGNSVKGRAYWVVVGEETQKCLGKIMDMPVTGTFGRNNMSLVIKASMLVYDRVNCEGYNLRDTEAELEREE